MSFPAYEQYKDSGIEWLGQIPAHWKVYPVKSIARVINGHPFDSNLFHSAVGIPVVRIRDLGNTVTETFYTGECIQRAIVTSADVLIGMDGDFNVGRWRGEGEALLNQRMCCVRGQDPTTTRFLEYALAFPLKIINDVTFSTTVKHLSSFQVEKTCVAMPDDCSYRQRILTFLDRETAKIDALVGEQRRLIELLKEKRQAVISHAVTKGLNPDVPMKPSGIDWLGDVPEHWEVLKGGMIGELFGSEQVPEASVCDEGDVPFVKVGSLALDSFEIESWSWFVDRAVADQYKPRSGYIVFPKRGAAIYTNKVGIIDRASLIDPNLMGWEIGDRAEPRYIAFVLKSRQLHELADVSTVPQINNKHIAPERFPVPPRQEQREISEFIDSELIKLDALTAEAERAIELLQERRTALISAAVTGKIDVRGLAAQAEAA